MDIGAPMGKADYSTVGSGAGFCRAIDSGIHGRIHVLVGNKQGMGAVPYAARDPLFWVHHSQHRPDVGELEPQRRRQSRGRRVGAEQLCLWRRQRPHVERAMNAFFDCATLGYGYDAYIPRPGGTGTTCWRSAGIQRKPTSQKGREGTHGRRTWRQAGHVTLVPIARHARGRTVLGLDPQQPGRRTYLVLKDLHTWEQPEVLFHVYLRPTRGGGLNQDSHVGNINFFDAEFHDHGGGAMGTRWARTSTASTSPKC